MDGQLGSLQAKISPCGCDQGWFLMLEEGGIEPPQNKVLLGRF